MRIPRKLKKRLKKRSGVFYPVEVLGISAKEAGKCVRRFAVLLNKLETT